MNLIGLTTSIGLALCRGNSIADVTDLWGRSGDLRTYLQVIPLVIPTGLPARPIYVDSWNMQSEFLSSHTYELIPSLSLYADELSRGFRSHSSNRYRIIGSRMLDTKVLDAMKPHEIVFYCYPKIAGEPYAIRRDGKASHVGGVESLWNRVKSSRDWVAGW